MSIYYTDEKLIQIGTALFETLNSRKELAQELAEYGYDAPKIAEGKALYDKAITSQEANRKETKEEIQALEVFNTSYKDLLERYKAHRKRARIVFKDEPSALKILALKGTMPLRTLSALEEIEILYTELDKDENYKKEVLKLKITQEQITEQLAKLAEAKNAYAKYTTEKGESQQATKDKTQAFGFFEKWVRDFYTIAKIALEDKPQLLESLGKFMRS